MLTPRQSGYWHVCKYLSITFCHTVTNAVQMALGLVVKFNDRTVLGLREANGGKFERNYSYILTQNTKLTLDLAEMRLATTVYFAPFIPISLFIYAWTARASVH